MYNSLTVNKEGWSGGGRVIGVIGIHPLSMVDTRGVVTGVGVGVFVFEGLGLLCLFDFLAALFLLARLIVEEIQVPSRLG